MSFSPKLSVTEITKMLLETSVHFLDHIQYWTTWQSKRSRGQNLAASSGKKGTLQANTYLTYLLCSFQRFPSGKRHSVFNPSFLTSPVTLSFQFEELTHIWSLSHARSLVLYRLWCQSKKSQNPAKIYVLHVVETVVQYSCLLTSGPTPCLFMANVNNWTNSIHKF